MNLFSSLAHALADPEELPSPVAPRRLPPYEQHCRRCEHLLVVMVRDGLGKPFCPQCDGSQLLVMENNQQQDAELARQLAAQRAGLARSKRLVVLIALLGLLAYGLTVWYAPRYFYAQWAAKHKLQDSFRLHENHKSVSTDFDEDATGDELR